MKQIASPGSMHETGCSGLVYWDDPEGWDAEGGGRGVQDGDTCTPMTDSCQCMAKTTTILQSNYSPIKINKLKKLTVESKRNMI